MSDAPKISQPPSSQPLFDTVLVANRGEIACRIISTLKVLGIRSVAVYSEPDAGARHVREADAALCIGPAAAAESYLNIAAIVAACRESGAEAVHPGYGFLSENQGFAQALKDADITFIGPNVEALNVMGDKIRSKNHVGAAGVPLVPGIAKPGLSDADLIAAAQDIGFPLLIKPSAGGGGKGMHNVFSAQELPAALATARRVATAAFGDDTLFLERLVANPRHIEVQILGDNFGNIVHLGERECSLQRRHQKVIEEAPSPLLTDMADGAAVRARIGAAACAAAASVDYTGAGTVEFLVSNDRPDEFFFMEMNTRLQVEHPVTEMVARVAGEPLDLVQWQLRIAAGEPLTFSQDEVAAEGHAMEARVYAENPAQGFLPSTGTVVVLDESVAGRPGVRVDSSLLQGLEISADYDPMLAKVIAWGTDREQSLGRLDAALRDYVVLGVPTNVEYLRLLLADPDVHAGRLDTTLIERKLPELAFRTLDAGDYAAAALLTRASADRSPAADRHSLGGAHWREGPVAGLRAMGAPGDYPTFGRERPLVSFTPPTGTPAPLPVFPWSPAVETSPWGRTDGWRLGDAAPWRLAFAGGGRTGVVTVSGSRRGAAAGGPGVVHVSGEELADDGEHTAALSVSGTAAELAWDGETRHYRMARNGAEVLLGSGGWTASVQLLGRDAATARMLAGLERADAAADPQVRSPMPGTVTMLNVSTGDKVEAGAVLLAVEAMKMEHQLVASIAGTVHVGVAVGALVKADQVVATIVQELADAPHEKLAKES
ncbi:biotin carboxylase N-terminal domain-containing protein [Arthrobacter sp. H35-D1]|uniref:acetyl/propionyl/methylcrotonyl-CoA carboxylase subunit alpha n=1 Tax=Arthrobacter sp. H35-D1 TaxID=3046202 RepID=UPI0024BAAF90|nr:biotin carboxylase N-terminal domain-containing protein [Arthrobacter sp. H35-D1]MDJ0313653.1 biotin carboxylase N-terminal domain-containing protein [Arthrobacter sp. H35-D1]